MRKFILFLIAVLVIPASATAHSLYIQSGRHHVSKGKGTPLFFCYGHHIPVDDAVRRKKLSYVRVTDPEGMATDIALRDEKSLHSYVVEYEKPGTYVLTAETKPGYFTMWYDKKNRKRHTMRPMDTIADKASKIQTSLRSSQWTKSYVVCEAPSKTFPAHIGLPLEIVPLEDVTLLTPGDKAEFMVYMDGKPYTGEGFFDATYNGFSPHSEDMYIQRTRVENGKFSVSLDAQGKWFVRFFTKTPSTGADTTRFKDEKKTTTLVFEVMGERKRPKIDSH